MTRNFFINTILGRAARFANDQVSKSVLGLTEVETSVWLATRIVRPNLYDTVIVVAKVDGLLRRSLRSERLLA